MSNSCFIVTVFAHEFLQLLMAAVTAPLLITPKPHTAFF